MARAVATDPEGVYVAGQTLGTLPDQVSAGGQDAFLRKYSSGGSLIWTRQFGTPANDHAYALAADATGVYVAGFTQGIFPGQSSAGGYDAFLRKYDVAGTELWTRQFGSSALDYALALAADATGVYVAGITQGSFPGQSSAGDQDAFLRKYDSAGNELWTRQFGTSTVEWAEALATDPTGVYVAGYTWGVLAGQANAGQSDAFLRKYGANGNVLWTVQFGTPTTDWAQALGTDNTGVYVGGSTTGTLPGQTSSGSTDVFLCKYGSGGNALWLRQFGSIGEDNGRAVTVDATGVYVAGVIADALPGQTNLGANDAFIRKYDAVGNEVWTSQFGTSGSELALALAVDATGVYVAGYSSGALPGQTNAGGTDAFVRKYGLGRALDCAIPWIRQWGSTTDDAAEAIAIDATGVYVGGEGNGYGFLRKTDACGNEIWTSQFVAGTTFVHSVAVDSTGVYVAGYNLGAGDWDGFLLKYDFSGTWLWSTVIQTPYLDQANGIAVDATGVYLAGLTGGTLPGQTSAGGWDAFLRKYDRNGIVQWTRQFGTSGNDWARAATSDATGVYVAGLTGGALPGQTNAGMMDSFVRKYDSGGNEVWTRQFGSSADDYTFALDTDASGLYAAGYTVGILPGQTGAGQVDAFVLQYDSAGTLLWTRQFGTAGIDRAYALAIDSTGVYVGGYTDGTFQGQLRTGGTDAFLRKYDAGGGAIWTIQFGTSADDEALGVAVDTLGVYVAGDTDGAFPGYTNPSPGTADAFLGKFGLGCTLPWTRQFGTTLGDHATALAVGATGVYVAGYTLGTFADQTSAGGMDAFLRKYDVCGNVLWTRQFGTPGEDRISALATYATGIYVVGWTFESLPGQTSAGGQDAFLRRYNSYGEGLWTRQFGTSMAEAAYGVAVDVTGIYVAGATQGIFPGQASAGGWDAFLRKYDFYGNTIWTRQFGTSLVDTASAVTLDSTGAYVAGSTDGALPGQTSAGGPDAFLRKYTASGAEVWTHQFGSLAGDTAYAATVDVTGVYVAGSTAGAFSGQSSAGGIDAFLSKHDSGGNALWTRQFGTQLDDRAYALAANPAGVYVAGPTTGAFPGETNAGDFDAFLRAYGSAGDVMWTHQFGTPANDQAWAASADVAGVYVAGLTGGTLPGQTSAGGFDAFVGQPWIQAPALLRVTTNPAVAAKIFVDGVPRDEWGLAWMKIAPGTHTVSFGGVAGFATPSSVTATLTAGQTTTIQGNYLAKGYLRAITAANDGGGGVPSTISVDGVPRDDWGMWTSLPPGTYTVHFGAVAGYDPPADQIATVVAGTTTTVTGNFVANPSATGPDPSSYGMLRVTTNPALAVQILVNGIPMDDWGLAWVKLAPGTYTVSFGDAYGVTQPSPHVVTVAAGETTTYDAVFTVHGALRVTTSPALPATISVDGVPRNDWGMWQSMPPGTYAVNFGDVPGYETPPPKVVTVTAGALTSVTGSYTEVAPAEQLPSLAVSGGEAASSIVAVPRGGSSKEGA